MTKLNSTETPKKTEEKKEGVYVELYWVVVEFSANRSTSVHIHCKKWS